MSDKDLEKQLDIETEISTPDSYSDYIPYSDNPGQQGPDAETSHTNIRRKRNNKILVFIFQVLFFTAIILGYFGSYTAGRLHERKYIESELRNGHGGRHYGRHGYFHEASGSGDHRPCGKKTRFIDSNGDGKADFIVKYAEVSFPEHEEIEMLLPEVLLGHLEEKHHGRKHGRKHRKYGGKHRGSYNVEDHHGRERKEDHRKGAYPKEKEYKGFDFADEIKYMIDEATSMFNNINIGNIVSPIMKKPSKTDSSEN